MSDFKLPPGLSKDKLQKLTKKHKIAKPYTIAKLKKIIEHLPIETQYHIKYKPTKITSSYVKTHLSFLEKGKTIITGSYRRGMKCLNDVDIVLAPGKTIKKFINDIEKNTTFRCYVYSDGERKTSFIMKRGRKSFKVDVWSSTSSSYPFMVL